MKKEDKEEIYGFMQKAITQICGYTPRAYIDGVVFTDDPPKNMQSSRIGTGLGNAAADGGTAETNRAGTFELDNREGTRIDKRRGEGEAADRDLLDNPLTLESIARDIDACTQCPLCKGRKHTVPGTGIKGAYVLVIGEGPGEEEDISGLPFVGKAGQLLDKMLIAINLDRKKNCFIANVVKCRPPRNRTPTFEEADKCLPFLERQIAVLSPRFILAMGRTAGQALLGISASLTSMRGRWYDRHGIPLLVTYHPSALLRDPTLKKYAWEDLKVFRARLEKECPDYKN